MRGLQRASLLALASIALGAGLAGCAGLPTGGGAGRGLTHRLPELRLATDFRGGRSRATGNAGSSRGGPAAARGYRLGGSDVIEFRMFGQPDMTTTLEVAADGRVFLPLVGTVDIGGLTPAGASRRIAAAYRAGSYFTDPQVNITVSKYRSRRISVLGEVNQPGRYPLQTTTTVLDALALARGEKLTGARTITVIHTDTAGDKRYRRVDTDALVGGGHIGAAPALAAGDIVYVPRAQQFYIYGQVQKPDAYPIEAGMTVMQAIAVGGGLTANGSNSRIQIRRDSAHGSRTIAADLTDRVRPGDVIFVKERFF